MDEQRKRWIEGIVKTCLGEGIVPTVYIGASSKELNRAQWYMNHIRDMRQMRLAHDWVNQILFYGTANYGLTNDERNEVSDKALAHVRSADIFWLLTPTQPTIGAWVELGHFLRGGRWSIASGPGHEQTIFTARCDLIARTDQEALDALVGIDLFLDAARNKPTGS